MNKFIRQPKVLVLLCLVFFSIYSCGKKAIKKDIKLINIAPEVFGDAKALNLSKIASKIEYISLETGSEVLLGSIYNSELVFFNDKILLKSNGGTIYV